MHAIIETGGKQYCVKQGDVLCIEKIEAAEGTAVVLDKVLLVGNDDGSVVVGKPYVEGLTVSAKVVEHGKGDKVLVFKYKPKKKFRKLRGHRQPYTKIEIEAIGSEAKAEKKTAKKTSKKTEAEKVTE